MAYGCTAVAGIEAIILYVTIEQLINSIDCSLQNDNELAQDLFIFSYKHDIALQRI